MPVPNSLFTLRADADARVVRVLDQTQLPWHIAIVELASLDEAAHAIRSMQVRGAPLIGVTAAFGVALALAERASDEALARALAVLGETRPTAVNLNWALARMRARLVDLPESARAQAAWREAQAIADEDAATNRAIGEHGLAALRPLIRACNRPFNFMTHCNAGWLATVAHGTALAPIYAAHAAGLPVHVWVSETRPRNQGLLTQWELAQAGVPHTVIADNAAGHLLAHGEVDALIVGADRIAANGDAANKIGTYLKALAAKDNEVPFFVAAPLSTVDWQAADGKAIPIEARGAEEVQRLNCFDDAGQLRSMALMRAEVCVANPAFDVTPARLIHGIITERACVAPAELRGLATAGAR